MPIRNPATYPRRRRQLINEPLEERRVLSTTTGVIVDILPGAVGSQPESFIALGATAYFTANSEAHGIELWKTDGTPGGTSLVKDIRPGVGSASPANMTVVGDELFFSAEDSSNGVELWKTDGTADGTTMVADIASGGASSSPSSLVEFGGQLYFAATVEAASELWKSDGTTAGTSMVADIHPGGSSAPDSLTAVGNQLFFVADNGATGRELWVSDGTNVRQARDIAPGTSSSLPRNLTGADSRLFFAAQSANGFELWTSDGTEAGTAEVRDIHPGSGGSNPAQLTEFAGDVYFVADNSVNGAELWRTDGTLSGTNLVRDLFQGPQGAGVAGLTVVGDTLYFAATDGIRGSELWATDGSAAGTALVANILAGSDGSSPAFLTSFKGELFFAASTANASFNQQVWASDGSQAGTRSVLDVRPQTPFTPLGTTGLVFSGQAPATGREPWLLVVNRAPIAAAGQEYFIEEGNALTLNGTRSVDPDGESLEFAWDVNGDGVTDATGATPTLSRTQLRNLDPPLGDDGEYSITLRVTDASGSSATDQARLVINNVAPAINSILAPAEVLEGGAALLTASVFDPADEFDPQLYSWDFGDGSPAVQGIGLSAPTHVFQRIGAFNVTLTVNDGDGGSDVKTISLNVQESPRDMNAAPNVVDEHSPIGTTVNLTADAFPATIGGAVTYSLLDDAGGRFSIDANSGIVTVANSQTVDFEVDTVHEVTVQAQLGGDVRSNPFTILVRDINDPPQLNSPANYEVEENSTPVGTLTGTDQDNDDLQFAIIGGPDAALLAVDPSSGALRFRAGPDFEQPADANADNVYEVDVEVADVHGARDQQTVFVTVRDANELPVITSPSSFTVEEGIRPIGVVQATDIDGDDLTFTIVAGPDQDRISIDPATNGLSFLIDTDFESPADVDRNNIFNVDIEVSDGKGGTDTQRIAVTVLDVNETPAITSATELTALENDTPISAVIAADPDADELTYAIVGGEDADLLLIDAETGRLAFVSPRDFENPTDGNQDNTYVVDVRASDPAGLEDTKTHQVVVLDANDPPEIAPLMEFERPENANFGGVITATDPDQGDVLQYVISGGPDASRLHLDATTGLLLFDPVPDFEQRGDADRDNVYELQIAAVDRAGERDISLVKIRVTDQNETPEVTSEREFVVPENREAVTVLAGSDPDGDPITFELAGGPDMGQLSLDATRGLLQFNTPPDFEAPTDQDGDNVYEIDVTVTDSEGLTSKPALVRVTVTNQNETPTATNDNFFSNEDTVLVVDALAGLLANDTDPDGIETVTVGSADSVSQQGAALAVGEDGSFRYDPTRVAGLQSLPDGQTAIDVFAYVLSDGTTTDRATVTIRVQGINDVPQPGDDVVSISEDTINVDLTGNLLANDVDVDLGQTENLTIVSVDDASTQGILQLDRGFVTYTPGPTFEPLAEGETATDTFNYTVRDTAGATATARMVVTVIGQNPAPTVTGVEVNGGSQLFDGLSSLGIAFDADISASLDAGDLSLRNASTNQSVDTAGATVVWDTDSSQAVWDFSAVPLAMGRYIASVHATGIMDASGRLLDGNGDGVVGDDFQTEVIVTVAGDANLDGEVGFEDFLILSQNFSQDGAWSEGSWDGDGTVDFEDFLILSVNFGLPNRTVAAATDAAFGAATASGAWWFAE